MDSYNSAAHTQQRSAGRPSMAAGVSSATAAGAVTEPGVSLTSDFDPEGTTLKQWNKFPPPPLSHYDTPYHTYWNPALPQSPEKCSPIGPELERAIDNRVESTNVFADKQDEIRTDIFAIDEIIRDKQRALEEVRHNKRELNVDKTKDLQTIIVEMEQCLFVERDLMEELEWLRERRKALAKEGKERIEEWLRAERKKYRGY